MAEIAEIHKARLKELKASVEASRTYFNSNVERYHSFMKFIFQTGLTSEDQEKLLELQKPQLEFNVIESIISRQRGEFARQEPTINVKAADGVTLQEMTENYIDMMKVLEAHMKELISDAATDGLQYKVFTDTMGGGFSVAEVYTEYLNDMSFDQKIVVKRVFDPTMTGFDPLARESHKGDGQYCFQLFPWSKEKFIEEFGEEKAKKVKFSRGGSIDGFNWSYNNNDQDILLICEYFEKKMIKTKVVKLTSGHVVTKKHYEELLEKWNERHFIEQAPRIVAERMTELETIVRYRFCETEMLSYDKTMYRYLPLVFIDGNSVEMRDTDQGNTYQMCRPYAYHAKGMQLLLNFAGQTLGQELENLVQHKFKVAVEAIPDDYLEAYRNVQKADVLMYNAFHKNDPQTPLPPPMEIQRTPTPPIVESVFYGSNKIMQVILGAYDSVLGTNEGNVSGKAIANASVATSSASMPYLISYIHGLNRIAQILLDLIPKIYVTPRSIPIIKPDGKRSYQLINDDQNPNSIKLKYKPNDLSVQVEAGVNTAIQKQVALDQIIKMMQASPLFAQFINTDGLEILLDNLDIRGIEELKVRADAFMKQLKEQQQAQAQQPDPMQEMVQATIQLEQAQVENKKQQVEAELAIKSAQVATEKQKVDAQVAQIMNEIEESNYKMALETQKIDSENARTAIEMAMELTERHMKENSENSENDTKS